MKNTKKIQDSYCTKIGNDKFSFFEYEDGSFSKTYYKGSEFILSECSYEEYYINKPSKGGFYCGS